MNRENQHREICKELTDTYIRKNNDYGNSFGILFQEYGLPSLVIRLSDKLERLKTLIKSDQMVKDESIRDTIMDMTNYGIMGVMELDNPTTEKYRIPDEKVDEILETLFDAHLYGYKYLAIDDDNEVYVFKKEPKKDYCGVWGRFPFDDKFIGRREDGFKNLGKVQPYPINYLIYRISRHGTL